MKYIYCGNKPLGVICLLIQEILNENMVNGVELIYCNDYKNEIKEYARNNNIDYILDMKFVWNDNNIAHPTTLLLKLDYRYQLISIMELTYKKLCNFIRSKNFTDRLCILWVKL